MWARHLRSTYSDPVFSEIERRESGVRADTISGSILVLTVLVGVAVAMTGT